MSDDPASPNPARVKVTQAWLAQNRAKRLAYEEHRRSHTRTWFRRGEPDDPGPNDAGPNASGPTDPEPAPSGRARKASSGKVHDKRQGSFDL